MVTVELAPHGGGTQLTLTHAGFPHQAACTRTGEAWPVVLQQLDESTAPADRRTGPGAGSGDPPRPQ